MEYLKQNYEAHMKKLQDNNESKLLFFVRIE